MTTLEKQGSFQSLIEEHRKILYKVCNVYCKNRDDQDDLAQEIIVQLWHSFPTFDGRCRFSTWMYRIALNIAISFYRREKTRRRHVLSGEEHLFHITDDTYLLSDELLMLYQFIERLDPLHKGLVLLYLDGNSYSQIADVLGISETNVATKISRLKKTITQEFGRNE